MTAGNGVRATTPFLPSTSTGGVDPCASCPEVDEGDNSPALHNPETASMGSYGWRPANLSMQIPEGPPGDGENSLTFGLANADATGAQSMQDQTGPKEAGSPKALNTDDDDLRPYADKAGHFEVGANPTPMDEYANMNGFYGVRASGQPMDTYADVTDRI